jgi:hypothetical protein
MAITINISDSATALPSTSNANATVPALDAGASVALAPAGGTDAAAHVHTRDHAQDGGAPPDSLVQEIEAALRAAGATTPDASSSAVGMSAGAAPV